MNEVPERNQWLEPDPPPRRVGCECGRYVLPEEKSESGCIYCEREDDE